MWNTGVKEEIEKIAQLRKPHFTAFAQKKSFDTINLSVLRNNGALQELRLTGRLQFHLRKNA